MSALCSPLVIVGRDLPDNTMIVGESEASMIVRTNPPVDLDQADQAWFDSDASTNTDAIREVDAEAAKH
jgi:hypothetical protein